MRIPVTQLDLQNVLTPIATKMIEAWGNELCKNLECTDIVAIVFGYQDWRSIEISESVGVDPAPRWDRKGVISELAWNAFGALDLDYFEVRSLIEVWPLRALDLDRSTLDAYHERMAHRIMIDEMNYYIGNKTLYGLELEVVDSLIDAGALPYEFAIVTDNRAFSFQLLADFYNRLPSKWIDRLESVAKYEGMEVSNKKYEFLHNYLIPRGYASPIDCIARYKLLPAGYTLAVVGDYQPEMDMCLNISSGFAALPYKFKSNSDARAHVVHSIMVGAQIDGLFPGLFSAKSEDLEFTANGGIRNAKLNGNMHIVYDDWIDEAQVPEPYRHCISPGVIVEPNPYHELINYKSAALVERLNKRIHEKIQYDSTALSESFDIGEINRLCSAIVLGGSSSLDSFVFREFNYPDAIYSIHDDTQQLAVKSYQLLGGELKLTLGILQFVDDAAVGWAASLVIDADREALRNEEWRAAVVKGFCTRKILETYLAIIYAQCAIDLGHALPEKAPRFGLIKIIVIDLIEALRAKAASPKISNYQNELASSVNIYGEYNKANDFVSRLFNQIGMTEKANKALKHWELVNALRSEGKYLYVSELIDTKAIAERAQAHLLARSFSSGRKYSITQQ